MSKKQLLLVVHHKEEMKEAVSYTLELAKIMDRAVSFLILYKRKMRERFEDYMVATTFAEESDFKTAKEIIINEAKDTDYKKKLQIIKSQCKSSGIEFAGVSISNDDVISAIKNLLKGNSHIDMVLLSPSVTQEGYVSARDLQRLVRTISRPVVTMSKNVKEKTA